LKIGYVKPKPSSYLVVRGGGLEPPHHCWRQDLNLVRLPISPSSREFRKHYRVEASL
jgi:hypothetical protein